MTNYPLLTKLLAEGAILTQKSTSFDEYDADTYYDLNGVEIEDEALLAELYAGDNATVFNLEAILNVPGVHHYRIIGIAENPILPFDSEVQS